MSKNKQASRDAARGTTDTGLPLDGDAIGVDSDLDTIAASVLDEHGNPINPPPGTPGDPPGVIARATNGETTTVYASSEAAPPLDAAGVPVRLPDGRPEDVTSKPLVPVSQDTPAKEIRSEDPDALNARVVREETLPDGTKLVEVDHGGKPVPPGHVRCQVHAAGPLEFNDTVYPAGTVADFPRAIAEEQRKVGVLTPLE